MIQSGETWVDLSDSVCFNTFNSFYFVYYALFTFNFINSARTFFFCLGITSIFDHFQIVRVPLVFSFLVEFLPDISLY